MRKGHREAEKLLLAMGFKIIGSGRSKHHYWILEAPDGKQFKQPIPHNTSEGCFWHNWKSQLRKHLPSDCAINARRAELAGHNGSGASGRTGVDARQRQGDRK